MTETRDETILHITARYVEELRAGKQPRLSDYLARYPHYAEEIADFVAYYHAVEAHLPPEQPVSIHPESPESLSHTSRTVLDRVLAQQPDSNSSLPTTLLSTAEGQRLTPAQLAEKLNLSSDIILQLEQHRLRPETLPGALYRKLAQLLHYSTTSIHAYLAEPGHSPEQDDTLPQKIAERRSEYAAPEHAQRSSFRTLLERDPHLTAAQKAHWHTILENEGL